MAQGTRQAVPDIRPMTIETRQAEALSGAIPQISLMLYVRINALKCLAALDCHGTEKLAA
ncbi:MAG: hypothetical protein ABW006_07060 [Hyphomicrobium sp.]